MLTVGELKKLLAELPDDAPVLFYHQPEEQPTSPLDPDFRAPDMADDLEAGLKDAVLTKNGWRLAKFEKKKLQGKRTRALVFDSLVMNLLLLSGETRAFIAATTDDVQRLRILSEDASFWIREVARKRLRELEVQAVTSAENFDDLVDEALAGLDEDDD